MPAKRTADNKAKTSVTKKARVAKTPLEKNVEIVKRGLENEDFIIPCREMMMTLGDIVLKVPKEERHGDQETVFGMMEEIFANERARWEAREAKAKSDVDAATAEREEKVALKDAADAEVKAQRTEVSAKEDQQFKAIQVIEECEQDLQQASLSRSESEGKRSDLVKEQTEVHATQEMMVKLKAGTCENPKEFKKLLSTITSFFKSIDVEEALLRTIPQIFNKKPEERGGFDEVALTQIDAYIENHMNALGSKIQAAGKILEEHDVAVTAWQAALELAQDKKRESDDALKAAQDQQELLDAALKAARNVVKEHTALVKARNNDLLVEQVGLGEMEEAQKALEFVQDYTPPPPQEEPAAQEEPAKEIEVFLDAAKEVEDAAQEPAADITMEAVEVKAKQVVGDGMDLPNIPSPLKQNREALVA